MGRDPLTRGVRVACGQPLEADATIVAGDRIELAANLQRLPFFDLATGQAIWDDGERGISASPGNLAAFEEETAARPV